MAVQIPGNIVNQFFIVEQGGELVVKIKVERKDPNFQEKIDFDVISEYKGFSIIWGVKNSVYGGFDPVFTIRPDPKVIPGLHFIEVRGLSESGYNLTKTLSFIVIPKTILKDVNQQIIIKPGIALDGCGRLIKTGYFIVDPSKIAINWTFILVKLAEDTPILTYKGSNNANDVLIDKVDDVDEIPLYRIKMDTTLNKIKIQDVRVPLVCRVYGLKPWWLTPKTPVYFPSPIKPVPPGVGDAVGDIRNEL